MSAESYRWKPISAWHSAWLPSTLPQVWRDFRPFLNDDAHERIRKESAREWSIETGQIERAFDLDRGVTIELIRQGFIPALINYQENGLSKQHVALILEDTEQALDFLFDRVKSAEPLTISFIKQLHQLLLRNIAERDVMLETETGRVLAKRPLVKGEYKREPNSPLRRDGSVHEYCPPEQVPGQMEKLIEVHRQMRESNHPPEVIAAWLHHAFTQIHPFQDGNGRVARSLATLELLHADLPPFTVPRDMEARYYDALLQADLENLKPLNDLFESCLYRQTVRYWHSLESSGLPPLRENASLPDILEHARRKLEIHNGLLPQAWEKANQMLGGLHGRANAPMQQLSNNLHELARSTNPQYKAQFGTALFSPDDLSVGKLESWGPDFSQAAVNASLISIESGAVAKIILLVDKFHEKRRGLSAIALVYRTESGDSPLAPTYFIDFHSTLNQSHFDAWLTEGLRKAAFRWTESL